MQGIDRRGWTAVAGAFAWAFVCLLIAAGPAAAAEPSGDPAAPMYDPGKVDVIRLTLPPASKQKLEANPDLEYVEGTFSRATTGGTPGSIGAFSTPVMVGIRLKGKYGSFRTLAQKAAFKIKFNFENEKGEKGKKFLGLKKMTLNNMVQDPSQVHERLAYDAFRAAKVPSPRTGYAYVEVNGEDYGLHLNVETSDDVALEARFGDFQHLYEGAYGSDVSPGGASSFEIDEGDEDDITDLEALVTAVNGTSPADFSDRVQSYADLVEMTRMWAVERYLGHWDGYTTRNNYYLFSDPLGRFQMLPWGTDQTWGDHLLFTAGDGILFTKCLADTSCAALYRKSLAQVQVAVNGLNLDSLATTTADLLKPWQTKEQSNSRHEHDLAQIAGAVQGTREFIADRPAELSAWLTGKPEFLAAKVAVGVQPGPIVADGVSVATAIATVTDAGGNPVPGEQLSFASSDPGQRFGEVVDRGDGTYSVPITASTVAGAKTITVTDTWASPDIIGTAALTQVPGPVSALAVALAPSSILADGISTTTATATAADLNGNPVPGAQISFSSTDPGQRFGAVVDHGDGTYSVLLTASPTAGTAAITATVGSTTPAVTASANLTQRSQSQAPQNQAPQGQGPPVGLGPLAAPKVRITARPSNQTTNRRPVFRFGAEESATTFKCRLDDRALRACDSPERLPRLALGPHVFRIVATNREGTAGPALVDRFTVAAQQHSKSKPRAVDRP